MFLQGARQRIVELQAQRAALQESGSPAPELAELDAMLSRELALERALIEQGSPKPSRPRAGGAPRMVTALVLLASLVDDGAVGVLELVSLSLTSLGLVGWG